MSAVQEMTRGRGRAERLMLDACTITRPGTGKGTWNESTGTYTPPVRVSVYSGKCKVQTRDTQVTTPDVAGRQAFVVEWTVHLPVVGSETVEQGDLVTITTAAYDTSLSGRTFTVLGPHVGTLKTARRLPVSAEVTA